MKVLNAKNDKEFEKALSTLLSIRGYSAISALRSAMQKISNELQYQKNIKKT